jgi:hypothetical protein
LPPITRNKLVEGIKDVRSCFNRKAKIFNFHHHHSDIISHRRLFILESRFSPGEQGKLNKKKKKREREREIASTVNGHAGSE